MKAPNIMITTSEFLKRLMQEPEFKRLGLKFVTMQLIKQDRAQAARIWESQ